MSSRTWSALFEVKSKGSDVLKIQCNVHHQIIKQRTEKKDNRCDMTHIVCYDSFLTRRVASGTERSDCLGDETFRRWPLRFIFVK